MNISRQNQDQELARSILKQRAKELAKQQGGQDEPKRLMQIIAFALGNETYGMEMGLLREVQPLERISWSPVPNTPGFILGMVNLRGRLFSLMDVGSFLGLPQRELSPKAHVMLLSGGRTARGEAMETCVLSDGMPSMRRVDLDAMQGPETIVSPPSREFVLGVTQDMVTVLNMENLLSDERIMVGQ